jgi:NitT/TauT family transport system permease protein
MEAMISPAQRAVRRAEALHRAERRERALTIWLGRVALLALVLGLWQLAAGRLVDASYVSRPSAVIVAWWELARTGVLWVHLGVTLTEFLIGFVCGGVLAVLAACVLTMVGAVYRIAEPYLIVIYGIPMIVLGPLLALWFGVGLLSKIVLAGLITFLLVLINTVAGTRTVNPETVGIFRVMGASRIALNMKLLLPHALPYASTALRLAVPLAMVGALLGEFLGASKGLGHLIEEQASFLAVDKMMAGVGTIGLVVMAFRLLLSPLEKWTHRGQSI